MRDTLFDLWYTHILTPWEGGIADRPLIDDPGGFTNKGVTIKVWREQAPKLFGIVGTEATLRKITKEQALTIAYLTYWKFYGIDKINNPAIKILVAESVWGGGGYKSLGYGTGTTSQRIAKINADSTQNPKLFDQLVQKRLTYLRSLSNYKVNEGGWEGRVWKGDYRLSLTQLVAKYKLNTVAKVAGISLLGATALFFWVGQFGNAMLSSLWQG